ncbi:MAG: hypothetical protein ACPGR5_01485 [Chitinophagales bacterium]
MKKVFYIFIMILFFSACKNFTGEVRTIEKDSFEIELPDWLEETNDLAPHAHYQFKSRYRNTYGIIVKTPKENKSFVDYQKEGVGVIRNFNEITNLFVTDSVYENNVYALQLMGDIDSEKVFYWHNTYESSNNYYQLVLWTRSYDRKQKYTPVIEKVINSFKIKE